MNLGLEIEHRSVRSHPTWTTGGITSKRFEQLYAHDWRWFLEGTMFPERIINIWGLNLGHVLVLFEESPIKLWGIYWGVMPVYPTREWKIRGQGTPVKVAVSTVLVSFPALAWPTRTLGKPTACQVGDSECPRLLPYYVLDCPKHVTVHWG